MDVARTSQTQSTWCHDPEKPSFKYHHTLKTSNLNPKSGFYKMLGLPISYSINKIEQFAATSLQSPVLAM
jgi:hypothetical protein